MSNKVLYAHPPEETSWKWGDDFPTPQGVVDYFGDELDPYYKFRLSNYFLEKAGCRLGSAMGLSEKFRRNTSDLPQLSKVLLYNIIAQGNQPYTTLEEFLAPPQSISQTLLTQIMDPEGKYNSTSYYDPNGKYKLLKVVHSPLQQSQIAGPFKKLVDVGALYFDGMSGKQKMFKPQPIYSLYCRIAFFGACHKTEAGQQRIEAESQACAMPIQELAKRVQQAWGLDSINPG